MHQPIDLEQLCAERGLRITEQRRVIARVLSESEDHPDVEKLHERASAIDPGISIATVYRTVRLFEEAGILDRHDFGDGRARYEAAPEAHHDHLIDVENLAVGYLAGIGETPRIPLPWDSDALSAAVGVDPEWFRRHEAMADAEWARAIYDRVMGAA